MKFCMLCLKYFTTKKEYDKHIKECEKKECEKNATVRKAEN